ncbi:hypothetical protein A6V39_03965 [Candidatus Mycoplasma haematobovis]|uniref:Uncharacterized protein n=1 Tax=Candidatus Mycoplasma haematobovis TaxID=432608 RepID=A0A1A9QD76_9MOLU|nr:hypothetical protein [Candidatus Mycoplasma haematobovis]OAL10044.1 hypothetical protein A6V39_03965 [Candidatus Mycoplasma haematobovis]
MHTVLNLFFRTMLTGSAGGLAYASTILEVSSDITQNKRFLKSTNLPVNIANISDIEIYEKFYGCKYVFIDSWGDKKIYNSNGFLEKHKEESWKEKMIAVANGYKEDCKRGKVITLSNVKYQGWNGFTVKDPTKSGYSFTYAKLEELKKNKFVYEKITDHE